MAYGEVKVNTITYDIGGGDVNISAENILVNGSTLISGASGIFTSTLSGATVTGDTGQYTNLTGVSGVFTTSISGATVTGDTGRFSNITGVSGVFTTRLSGATITGDTGQYTSLTGVSGVFTTTLSGATITGGTLGTTGAIRDGIGNVRAVPQNSQTTSYTLVSSDAGKHVFTVTGVTVPSGVFAVGDAVSVYNNTTGNITITQGTNVTLRQAGSSGTGNRTLAQRGLCTILCVSGAQGTEFVIGGAGVT